MDKFVILFLCTGNSCRSQMAEGFAKHYNQVYGGNFEIYSAGIEAHGLNPRAVEVMNEAGVSIEEQTSDIVTLSLLGRTDIVITLCGHANEHCPTLPPRARKVHWGFEDPAKATGTEEEIMEQFRRVRNQIDHRLHGFMNDLCKLNQPDFEKISLL